MINRVVLVGRLTKDPELRYTGSNNAVCNFTLAVNRNFTSQDGERDADFISVITWRKTAENASKYLRKGSLAGIDGRIQTRSYEANDGSKRFVTEVVADNVRFLDSRSETRDQDDRRVSGSQAFNNQGSSQKKEDPFGNSSNITIDDDDLPF